MFKDVDASYRKPIQSEDIASLVCHPFEFRRNLVAKFV